MQIERDIFIFSCKGNVILCFAQGVNSIRGHELLLLVLRTF